MKYARRRKPRPAMRSLTHIAITIAIDDRRGNRAERVPEVVRRATARRSGRRRAAVVVEPDEHRGAAALGRGEEALPQRRDGRVVREEHEQRHRRQQQQPAVEPLRGARHRPHALARRGRSGPRRGRRPLRLLLVRPQHPLRLALRVLHRLLRRLGAGERRLQPVVQRLASRAGCRASTARPWRTEAGRARPPPAGSPRRTASSPASPTRRRARRRSRCRCPTARRAAAS